MSRHLVEHEICDIIISNLSLHKITNLSIIWLWKTLKNLSDMSKQDFEAKHRLLANFDKILIQLKAYETNLFCSNNLTFLHLQSKNSDEDARKSSAVEVDSRSSNPICFLPFP